MTQQLFVEEVTERSGGQVICSTVRPATDEDIAAAKAQNPCQHTVIYDTAGYPYDIRYCSTCGDCLGLI